MKPILCILSFLFISAANAQYDNPTQNMRGKVQVEQGDVPTIKTSQIAAHQGKTVRICDHVSQAKYPEVPKERPSELLVGGDFPNHTWTLVIPKDAQLSNFRFDPEKKMVNKRFCVIGKVETYKDKPAIVVTNERMLNEED